MSDMYLILKHSKILKKWHSRNSLKPKSCFQRAVSVRAKSTIGQTLTRKSPRTGRKMATSQLANIEVRLSLPPLKISPPIVELRGPCASNVRVRIFLRNLHQFCSDVRFILKSEMRAREGQQCLRVSPIYACDWLPLLPSLGRPSPVRNVELISALSFFELIGITISIELRL